MVSESEGGDAIMIATLRDEACAAGHGLLVETHLVEYGSNALLDRLRAAIEKSVWPAGYEWS